MVIESSKTAGIKWRKLGLGELRSCPRPDYRKWLAYLVLLVDLLILTTKKSCRYI